jgi:hypothetical protein
MILVRFIKCYVFFSIKFIYYVLNVYIVLINNIYKKISTKNLAFWGQEGNIYE